jgi:Pyridoxamine 5'-phosphate oxidase
MSVPVSLDQIADQVERFGAAAFLITVGDGRAHPASVLVHARADGVLTMPAGRRTGKNIAERPDVTLLWAGPTDDGFALLVDGTATVADGTATVTPTSAILHKLAAPGD